VHMRMQLMVLALAQALEAAPLKDGAIDLVAVSARLSKASVAFAGQKGVMRELDHQFQQQLVVGLMDKVGTPGVKFDVEGSGYGFRVIKTIDAARAQMPTTCKMTRL
jgi:branched-chain amino acid transport system substrate-binding protein